MNLLKPVLTPVLTPMLTPVLQPVLAPAAAVAPVAAAVPAAVPSPCVNVCRMDAGTGWCEGCLRTLDEIGAWSQLGDIDKRAVWATLAARRVHWRANGRELQPLPVLPPP